MPLPAPAKTQLESFADMLDFDFDNENANGITEVDLANLKPFPDHQFKLYEGTRLDEMVESIQDFGILLPLIVWQQNMHDDQYTILSGHNRKHAAQLAGFTSIPVIIKTDLTMEDAVLIVTETNLRQRSFADLLHSERAYCLAQHYDAIKAQGKRNDIVEEIESLMKMQVDSSGNMPSNPHEIKEAATSSPMETKLRSDIQVAQNNGLSRATVARYIKIATLENALMELLDNETIGLRVAYALAFIENSQTQQSIADFIETYSYKLDMKKVEQLRIAYESGNNTLDEEMIEAILSGAKTDRKPKNTAPKAFKVEEKIIKQYFTHGETKKEINAVIKDALAQYFSSHTEDSEG